MTDLALSYASGAADLCLADGDLVIDDGLRSQGLMTLLTDSRASTNEVEPGEDDLRGWWGDALDDAPWGNKLWTLQRKKTLPEVLRRAEDYARAGLETKFVTPGIADRVEVTATREDGVGGGATLRLTISIYRPSGETVNLLYDLLWRAT